MDTTGLEGKVKRRIRNSILADIRDNDGNLSLYWGTEFDHYDYELDKLFMKYQSDESNDDQFNYLERISLEWAREEFERIKEILHSASLKIIEIEKDAMERINKHDT